jgi:Leucine-rich repeat (LRR) protein
VEFIVSKNDMHQCCNREEELQKLTHVKLDRERLTCLPPHLFLLLPNLTNLYLQQVQSAALSLSIHQTLLNCL